MAKTRKAFRLSAASISNIETLMTAWNCDATAVVERSLFASAAGVARPGQAVPIDPDLSPDQVREICKSERRVYITTKSARHLLNHIDEALVLFVRGGDGRISPLERIEIAGLRDATSGDSGNGVILS